MSEAVTPAALAATHAAAFVTDRPWSSDEFADLLRNGAKLTGDAACFVLGRVIADEAEILTVATHPDHQRKGLARQRLSQFHHDVSAAGAGTVFLEVAADNTAAIALYQGAGYVKVGQRPRYYARNDCAAVDALVLRRTMT